MLHIALIKQYNVMGVTECELRLPKGILKLAGENASGKSSRILGTLAALTGGHDASLIRTGETKGEVVIVIEDDRKPGEPYATIRKPLDQDPKKSAVKVKAEGFGTIGAAQTWIEDLLDIRAANPLEFLRLTDKKERAKWLLESIPLKYSAEDLAADSGLHPTELAALAKLHPLEQLRKAEALVTEKRRHENVTARDRRATIKTLADTAPKLTIAVDNLSPRLLETRKKEVDALQQSKDRDLEQLTTAAKVQRDAIAKQHASGLNAAAKLRDDAIAAAHAAYNTAVDIADKESNAALAKLDGADSALRTEVHNKYAEDFTRATTELEAAQRAMTDLAKIEQSNAAQAKFKTEAEDAERESRIFSACLDRLAARREQLLKANPLPDAEVVDGEILVRGIPWERVNEGERIDIAVQAAISRTGKLPFLCCDGIEKLDPLHRVRLVERILEEEVQAILTEVTPGLLTETAIDSVEGFKESERESARKTLEVLE